MVPEGTNVWIGNFLADNISIQALPTVHGPWVALLEQSDQGRFQVLLILLQNDISNQTPGRKLVTVFRDRG